MDALPHGIVYLVGAGPGDPGLLTLRGLECLQLAQVVVHDRLINPRLRAFALQAEWIDVGKQPEHHPIPQERINAILVEQALQGKRVVRLKGGDPFVFGRGGEEALALAEAGVPFEIVPGVTSAIAVPAYAGIPITQRGMACSAVLITGHRADCAEDPPADWRRAAQGADTLIFLMGVKNLERIVEQVLAAGRSPDTPVALIEQGTCPTQKTVTGTLADIVPLGERVRPPAILVIGEVVRLRQSLKWFERSRDFASGGNGRPLMGLRILNTRPVFGGRRDAFSQELSALGAEPVEFPTIRVLPMPDRGLLDEALRRLADPAKNGPAYDWMLFTSANAVRFTLERFFELGYDARCLAGVRIAAVGRVTAEGLKAFGLRADRVPRRPKGESLANEIGEASGLRLLLPTSDIASTGLVSALERQGAQVDCVAAYSVRPSNSKASQAAALIDCVDAATFFSPSALNGLANMLEGRSIGMALAPLRVVCVGPSTAEAARALGVRVDGIAEEQSVEGMCRALRICFQNRGEVLEAL